MHLKLLADAVYGWVIALLELRPCVNSIFFFTCAMPIILLMRLFKSNFFFFFFKGLVASCHSFFFYFTLSEHTYNIYIYNSSRTRSCCLHRFRSLEGLLWGAEPRFELGPALQQADVLLFVPRRTLIYVCSFLSCKYVTRMPMPYHFA